VTGVAVGYILINGSRKQARERKKGKWIICAWGSNEVTNKSGHVLRVKILQTEL
jgi:hypothetical protein